MKWIHLITALLLCEPLYAQQSATGLVIDRATREPLEQTIVKNLETGKNELTDKEGRFAPMNVQTDSVWIEVSYIGYQSKTLRIPTGESLIELDKSQIDMKDVTITAQSGNVLSKIDLNKQPARSAQDLLRLVPGLFIAQHQGGGKAEQIFLRGFDADHGTDVNISVDGLPVNLVSQAHGQGYADLHFLIPETVASYDFGKGPYDAAHGDFTTAGYVAYHTLDVPEHSFVKVEVGQYHNARVVGLLKIPKGYIAAEGLYFDGPFLQKEHFYRANLFGKFITPLGSRSKLTLTLTALNSRWRASGEIPNRAEEEGYIPSRFGVIDSSQGGYTYRANANAKIVTNLSGGWTLENQVYYSHYFFNLVSNFTFYYFYPQTGDEFNQHEQRNLYGYNSRLQHHIRALTTTLGASFRFDDINPSWLAHTVHGDSILGYLERGSIRESNANAYADESLNAGPWLIDAAMRVDYLHFYYSDSENPPTGRAILCPKFSIQYTFNPEFQIYLKGGKGFHSNDARVVVARDGFGVLPAAYGADLGITWKPLAHIFLNAALWYLYLQQEFTYGADLGDQAVMPGGKTRRDGIDLSARVQANRWLYAFVNVDLAKPREIGTPKAQSYLPLAPTFTSTAGLEWAFKNGLNGSLSYRYMHDRAANDAYSLTAKGYWITDLTLNYTKKKFEVGLSVENLLNVAWNESQFDYTSRLKYETSPVDEVSYTPGTPFFAKLKFTIFL